MATLLHVHRPPKHSLYRVLRVALLMVAVGILLSWVATTATAATRTRSSVLGRRRCCIVAISAPRDPIREHPGRVGNEVVHVRVRVNPSRGKS